MEKFFNRIDEFALTLTKKYRGAVNDDSIDFEAMNPVRRSPRLAQLDTTKGRKPVLAIEYKKGPSPRNKRHVHSTPKRPAPPPQKEVCTTKKISKHQSTLTSSSITDPGLQEEALEFIYHAMKSFSRYSNFLKVLLSKELFKCLGSKRYKQFMDGTDDIRVIPLIRIDENFFPHLDVYTSNEFKCTGPTPYMFELSCQVLRCIQVNAAMEFPIANLVEDPELQQEFRMILYGILEKRSKLSLFVHDLFTRQLVKQIGSERLEEFVDGTALETIRLVPMINLNQTNFPSITVAIKSILSPFSPIGEIDGMTIEVLSQSTRLLNSIFQYENALPAPERSIHAIKNRH